MADTVTSPRGAEISERSTELVLPDEETIATPLRREFGVSESEGTTTQALRGRESEGTTTQALRGREAKPANGGSAALAGGLTSTTAETVTTSPSADPQPERTTGLAQSLTSPSANAAPGSQETPATTTEAASASASAPKGAALPGDRGPRNQDAQGQRPSFWRRIALGRRTPPETPAAAAASGPPARSNVPATTERQSLAERAKNAVAPAPSAPAPVDTSAIENRIVEPLLQALVSVEAKLERSHGEIVSRSDQVEQRLTQLWDIEEQLGTLSELQESLLQVSEQQRRLETAVVSQTKTLRWLVGAVFFSLAAAAFVVAAVLR